MKGHEPRSSSSCAACKFLKRRCIPTCLFAPYFRSDEPKKFAKVHKVFGASNVGKILVEVPEEHRDDTVSSLVYEAEARLRDPVYGCIGAIALLQTKLVQLQRDLDVARTRLAQYAAVPGDGDGVPPLCSLLEDDERVLLMSPLLDDLSLPMCGEWGESFHQGSLELNQSGSMDELSQLPFPK